MFFKKKTEEKRFTQKVEKADLKNDKIIKFDDINLEIYVRKIIRREKGDIFLSDVYNIESMDFLGWPLISIMGIENIVNLKELILYQSKMNNITFLSKLTKLKKLDMSWSDSINEVNSLRGLEKLEELKLSFSPNVRSYNCLAEIESLRELDLSENKLVNIDFIYKMKNLEKLCLSKNYLNELKFDENIEKINYLDLSANEIEDISSLKNLKNLEYLDIAVNKIEDISVIKEMKKLKYLDIRGTKVNLKDKINKDILSEMKRMKCKVKK